MEDFTPTEAGFLAFVRDVMGIPVDALPDDAPVIHIAFLVSLALVLTEFALVSPILYQQAVYNLAASTLINFAPDQPNGPTWPGSEPPVPYFFGLRKEYGLNSFVAGVIQSSSDEGTSQSMVVPDFFKNLTIGQLQLLRDPWGRAYLAIAQTAGPLWGIS